MQGVRKGDESDERSFYDALLFALPWRTMPPPVSGIEERDKEMKEISEEQVNAVSGGDSWGGTPAGQQPASLGSCMDAATSEFGVNPATAFWECVIRMTVF
jgi:hypothetical protein